MELSIDALTCKEEIFIDFFSLTKNYRQLLGTELDSFNDKPLFDHLIQRYHLGLRILSNNKNELRRMYLYSCSYRHMCMCLTTTIIKEAINLRVEGHWRFWRGEKEEGFYGSIV